ncbi:MAG TPA: DUF4388 domain-containing protein [Ktedonobacterales bacterium]|nr:DUF4388 domain-containing protein [Ktedonobacterales bacterium]
MAKPRVTATDRLANVIEVVELGRRSGLLSVERGSGAMLEEGEVYFVSGRAIYALLAGLRGREALAMLGRWGECRFSFDTSAPRPAPNVSGGLAVNPPSGVLAPLPSSPPSYPGSPAYQANPRPANRPAAAAPTPPRINPYPPQSPQPADGAYQAPYGQPQHGQPQRGPASGERAERWGLPPGSPYIPGASGAPGGVESAPLPPALGGSGSDALNDSRGRMAPEAFIPQGAYASARPGMDTYAVARRNADPPTPRSLAVPTNQLERCPRRAPDLRDLVAVVSAHHLTRSHRAILLLANGEHTVNELARLSSKPVEEVSALLQELEQRGLVYYY